MQCWVDSNGQHQVTLQKEVPTNKCTLAVVHNHYKCFSVCVLDCVYKGDVHALQELSGCVSAFRESDNRGRLPLHTAAVQPQQEIVHVVLQGESSECSICRLVKTFYVSLCL